MDTALSILLILSALFTGAISPGPSFVLIANTTLSFSPKHGMGVGGVILSTPSPRPAYFSSKNFMIILLRASWVF